MSTRRQPGRPEHAGRGSRTSLRRDRATFGIEIKQEETEGVSATASRWAATSRGGTSGDPNGGGTSAGEVASARGADSETAVVRTLTLKGEKVGEFVGTQFLPRLHVRLGAAQSHRRVLERLGPSRGHGRAGNKQQVDGTRDVILPGWSADGSRIALPPEDRQEQKCDLFIAERYAMKHDPGGARGRPERESSGPRSSRPRRSSRSTSLRRDKDGTLRVRPDGGRLRGPRRRQAAGRRSTSTSSRERAAVTIEAAVGRRASRSPDRIDRRIFVFFFDNEHLSAQALLKLKASAMDFVNTRLRATDVAGVYENRRLVNGHLTNQHQELLDAIRASSPPSRRPESRTRADRFPASRASWKRRADRRRRSGWCFG